MSKPALFIVPSLSSFDAVAVCHRPGGMGPPVVAALAADKATARRIVSADYLASRAADDLAGARADAAAALAYVDRVDAALAVALADVERLTALNRQLEADIQLLRSAGGAAGETRGRETAAPKRRAGAARAVKPDYRTAAEVWLSGDKLIRPQRAAFKKSRGPQSVEVIFEDGIVMRVSTYLDGQAGLNQAAQFCRASRQAQPESMVDHLRRKAAGDDRYSPAQWVRDTTGTWRLVEIRPCPDVLTVQYAED